MLVKILLLTLLATTILGAVDETLKEKTKGEDVTTAVINKIHDSHIFPDDYDFLRRVAYVESKFGEASTTYRANYFGGIWQLDEKLYTDVKNASMYPSLTTTHAKIQSAFKINVTSTNWKDLLKPFYSGLMARLFMSAIEVDKNITIPQTIKLQAKYWNEHYNRNDSMTEANFTDAVSELENKTSTCKGKMDLLVLLDGSGSIGSADFEESLNFSANLFASYSSENVRKGFIQFSSYNEVRFSLNNTFNTNEITSKVLNTTYHSGGTNTNGGILESVKMYNDTVERPAGVPKILCIFTDGESNEGGYGGRGGVPDIVQAQNANITTFAIGIGPRVNQTELQVIANNDTSRIFELLGYVSLTEFYNRLNKETCEIPQKPVLNETTSDLLVQNEKRYYDFSIPVEGLTIYIEMVSGKTEGYYSYSMKTPNAALNDGVLKAEKTFIPRLNTSDGTNVFVAVKGLSSSNNYTIEIQQGNLAGASSVMLPINFLLVSLTAFLIMN